MAAVVCHFAGGKGEAFHGRRRLSRSQNLEEPQRGGLHPTRAHEHMPGSAVRNKARSSAGKVAMDFEVDLPSSSAGVGWGVIISPNQATTLVSWIVVCRLRW